VVARRQIAEALVSSLTSQAAKRKTFELVATKGSSTEDFDTLFPALEPDDADNLDGVRDIANMPLEQEPQGVRNDLDGVRSQFSA
jgi:hypothetical protein